MRRYLVGLAVTMALPLCGASAAHAQQEWLLNAAASRFYMQTAKNNATIEPIASAGSMAQSAATVMRFSRSI